MAESESKERLIELRRRAVAGDDGALEDLLTRLYEPVARVLRRRLGDDPYAEGHIDDLTQETLLRVIRCLGDCTATSSGQFLAWVLAIARRNAIDWIRAICLENATMIILPGVDAHASDLSMPDAAHSPELEAQPEDQSLLSTLRDLHDHLPAPTQRLLCLRVIENASWAEVAGEMRTTISGAKRRFQRAQLRLRRDIFRSIGNLGEGDRVRALARIRRMGVDI